MALQRAGPNDRGNNRRVERDWGLGRRHAEGRKKHTHTKNSLGCKKKQTKRGKKNRSGDFHLMPPQTHQENSDFLLFLKEPLQMLAPQRLGCNLPAAGWSITELKIISEPKYIEMGSHKMFDGRCRGGGRPSSKRTLFPPF